ncbi:MAG: LacI family transcriptional regulator [Nocardiopsaceae bacterium]|jgi:DNA-binding LacI/PurR family transcriptional regulator|nr:LacI family transcriptional regulator [Nocardiopsaceae bacterium]
MPARASRNTGGESKRPTLATVARAAAVSHQTVSNVINAPHLVRDETRRRVEAVIEETGYRPLKAAQTLRTRRSHLIAVIIPAPHPGRGELHNAFLHAVTKRAQRSGYRVLLFTGVSDSDEIRAYRELLDDYTLDAFVLTGTHAGDKRTSWLYRRRVPFVTFGRPWGGPDNHPWVDVDGASGERAATAHLIAAGHRRIAFLGWPKGSGVGDDRCAGWEAACREAGLPTAGLRMELQEDFSEGRTACGALMDSQDPPTAFACVSDTIALGAWNEITARGRVPGRDAAVTGFDDTTAAAVVGLTSVAQPLDEVADACLDALESLLTTSRNGRRRATARRRVLLEPRLVRRDSA